MTLDVNTGWAAKTGLLKALIASLALGSVLTSGIAAHADYLLSRAYRSATNAQYQRLFSSEIIRNGNAVEVAEAVELTPTLPDAVRVWVMLSINQTGQVVYGAYEPDNAALDDIFVVDLRNPGTAKQLNPPRAEGESVDWVQSNGDSPRVLYSLLDQATNSTTLYLADSRNPGKANLVAQLPTGSAIGRELILSPDANVAAYVVEPASGPENISVSFLNRGANSTVVHSNASLTGYEPDELKFSDDSSRLFWLDDSSSSVAAPLQSVAIDRVAGTVGAVVQVNGDDLPDEKVNEYEIKPGSNAIVAYRAFEAATSNPADVFVADLNNAGTTTKINTGPFRGAAFTPWEDVEWRGNSVLFNAPETEVLRADLYAESASSPDTPTNLTRQVDFSSERGSFASGVSHFVQSPDNDLTAMVDGDPALNLFVIDRFNIGTSFEPFSITPDRSLESITDPSQIPPRFNSDSDLLAMVIRDASTTGPATTNVYVANPTSNAGEQAVLNTESPVVFDIKWMDDTAVSTAPPTAIAAAVLPSSRSGTVGSTLTAFVTLINGGAQPAEACSIGLISNVAATLSYQTTDPATNAPVGGPDTPIDIAAGAAQSFVVSLLLEAAFEPQDTELAFSCSNADTVTPLSGLNTLLLSASATPVPDVIALAATVSNDGIARLDASGNSAFSVASVNVGAAGALTVRADTGATSLPVTLAMCQSDPVTAACINPANPTFDPISVDIEANGTPTFSVFVSSSQAIASDPAANRSRVVFTDSGGRVRGQTSVAIASTP